MYIKVIQEIITTELTSLIAHLSAGEKLVNLLSAIESYYESEKLNAELTKLVASLKKHIKVYQQIRVHCGFGAESIFREATSKNNSNTQTKAINPLERIQISLLKHFNLPEEKSITNELDSKALAHILLKLFTHHSFIKVCELRMQGTLEYNEFNTNMNQIAACLPDEIKQACPYAVILNGADGILKDAGHIMQRLMRYKLLGEQLKVASAKEANSELLITIADLLIELGGAYSVLSNEKSRITENVQTLSSPRMRANSQKVVTEEDRLKFLQVEAKALAEQLVPLRKKIKEFEDKKILRYQNELNNLIINQPDQMLIVKIKAAMMKVKDTSDTPSIMHIYEKLAAEIPSFKSIYDADQKHLEAIEIEKELNQELLDLNKKISELTSAAMLKANESSKTIKKCQQKLRDLMPEISVIPAQGEYYISTLTVNNTKKATITPEIKFNDGEKKRSNSLSALEKVAKKGRELARNISNKLKKKEKDTLNKDSSEIVISRDRAMSTPNATILPEIATTNTSTASENTLSNSNRNRSNTVAMIKLQLQNTAAESQKLNANKAINNDRQTFAELKGKVTDKIKEFEEKISETEKAAEGILAKVNKLKLMVDAFDKPEKAIHSMNSTNLEISTSPAFNPK